MPGTTERWAGGADDVEWLGGVGAGEFARELTRPDGRWMELVVLRALFVLGRCCCCELTTLGEALLVLERCCELTTMEQTQYVLER